MNRVALVTGAASGIGAATVRALAAAGATGLVLVDRDDIGLAAVAAETAIPTIARAHDVADEGAWAETEAMARDRFGGLDQVVVNAGIAEGAAIVDTSFASWQRVMSVNLDGAFLTLRAGMRLAREGAAIVLVASVAGLKAEPGIGAYAASKAAVIQLARVAAREAAPRRITVNAICPGGVSTPLWRTVHYWDKLVASKGSEAAALEAMAINTPMGRFATADEIAAQILGLMASPVTTGAALVVDGGYSL